ncbi:MAG TPA: hypothetical protein VK550_05750 [Polyangiaceae bacterium]|jgi:hypothetical protein|nr:hypothetical protein [Polyangiaceae bacterium]
MTVESRHQRRPFWPAMRAVLIAAAIGVGLVDGAPIPTARVMERLPPMLRALSMRLYDVQTFLLVPWRPIKDLFGVSQRWSVFSTTGGVRYRMWVEARDRSESTWSLLYRSQDSEHAFLADTLGYRRVRNVYNPSRSIGAKSTYPAFVSWLAHEIFEREARFDEVRVGMERGRILPRGEGFAPFGEFDYVFVRRRDEVLP